MAVISFSIEDHFPNGYKDATGHIVFEPSHRHIHRGITLATVRPFTVNYHQDFKIDLENTGPDWAWKITINSPRGLIETGYYAITRDEHYVKLTRVDPETLEPDAEPEPIWWAMARSTINSGSVDANGDLILTRTDGNTVNAGNVRGKDSTVPGPPGKDSTVPGPPGKDSTVPGPPGKDGKDGDWTPHGTILALARADGWVAVYDPSNTDTVTIAGGVLTSLRDGLGVSPPMNITGGAPVVVNGHIQGGTVASASGSLAGLTATYGALIECYIPGNSGASQFLLSGNGVSSRASISLRSNGGLAIGNGTTILWQEFPESGLSVVDFKNGGGETIMNNNGQLSFRGRPGTTPMGTPTNFRLGGFDNGTAMWGGSYGVFAVHPNPTPTIMNRMRKLVMSLRGLTVKPPIHESEVRALTLNDQNQIVYCKGEPDFVGMSTYASMTKVLTWLVARKYVTDAMMNDTIEILPGDIAPGWIEPLFQVGDIVSFKDLALATALPSNNMTPRTIARYCAATFLDNPDSIPPIKRFLQEINDTVKSWGWTNAMCVAVGGGARLSPRQAALMMKRLSADTQLKPIFGARTATINIQGPNARTEELRHTIDIGTETNTFPEFVTGKTGTSGGYAHIGATWLNSDGKEYSTIVTGVSTLLSGRDRYAEMFRAIQGAKNQINWRDSNNPGLLFVNENSTSTLDITSKIPGASKTSNFTESGVHLNRTGQNVSITFFDVKLANAITFVTGVLTSGLVPTVAVMGALMNVTTKTSMSVRVTEGGDIAISNEAGAIVRGSVTYTVQSRFPSPPYPGYIVQEV